MELESCHGAHVYFRHNCLVILENLRWKKSKGGKQVEDSI